MNGIKEQDVDADGKDFGAAQGQRFVQDKAAEDQFLRKAHAQKAVQRSGDNIGGIWLHGVDRIVHLHEEQRYLLHGEHT